MVTAGLAVAVLTFGVLQLAAVCNLCGDGYDKSQRVAALFVLVGSLVGDAGILAAVSRINGG